MRSFFFITVLFVLSPAVWGQKDTLKALPDSLPDRFYILQKVDRNGEELPEVEIKEVTIHAKQDRVWRRDYRQYEKLVRNIRKVYPYAVIVRVRLAEINAELVNIPGERDRKKYLREVEKNILREYEGEIENMTISQGKILIKLIDRETQNTSFELIRDYRGKFSAAFWQGIARFFGTNLKAEYDPYGEDALIELIIDEIDAGRL